MCVQTSNTRTTSAVDKRVSSMWNLMRSRRSFGVECRHVTAHRADTSSHRATVSAKSARTAARTAASVIARWSSSSDSSMS